MDKFYFVLFILSAVAFVVSLLLPDQRRVNIALGLGLFFWVMVYVIQTGKTL